MRIPRPLYYLLVGAFTQFILTIVALVLLVPTGVLGRLPWNMIGFLFAYNILIATLIAVILTNHDLGNKSAVLKGGGLVLGHLVGLLLGGFLGLKLGGALWAVIGAGLFYFLFGWLGARLSRGVGAWLDGERLPSAPGPRTTLRLIRPSTSSLFINGALIPAFLMAAAIFLRSSGLPFAQYPAILPTARTLLVILSLVSVISPWVRRARVVPRRASGLTRGSALWLIGLGLSLAPAFYGFLLFVAFDLSLAELSLFAVVASMAATAWGVSRSG